MKKWMLCAALALFLPFAGALAEDVGGGYVINYDYSQKIEIGEFSIYVPSVFDSAEHVSDSFTTCYANDCSIWIHNLEYTFMFSEEFAAMPKEQKAEILKKEMDDDGYASALRDADGCPAIVLMTYEKGITPVGEFDQYVKSTIQIFSDESYLEIELSTPDENKAMEFTDGILAHLKVTQ